MAKAASRKPARKKGASRKTSPKGGGVPGVLLLVLGLLLGLLGAFGWHLWQLRQEKPADAVAGSGKESAPDRHAAGNRGKDKKAGKPAEDESRFEFYTLLPNQEVMPGKKSAATRPAARPSQETSYLLQAGSFKSQDEADKRRATLLLLGLPVNVVKAGEKSGGNWFRVVVGPFKTREEADTARANLKGSGVEAILVKKG